MAIEEIHGFTLESFRLSKGSYSLEFSGKSNEEFVIYNVGTAYNLSVDEKNESDALEKSSEDIWPVLEQVLITTIEVENQIRFLFENGKELLIWQEENANDNLLIVRKEDSDEWFTVQ